MLTIFPPKIKSKYKENEKFTFRDAPKNFDSVTNATIRKLNKYCLAKNDKVFKNEFVPGALKAMLQAVAGQFNFAHRRLEGDYANRKGKLEQAYIEGISEIEAQIMDFENQVAVHNILFKQYSEICEKISGEKLSDSLLYEESEVKKMQKKCEKLKENL